MPTIDDALSQAARHLDAGRPDQAASLLKRAVQRAPSHVGANRQLAMILFTQGETEQAAYYIRRAVAADPDDAASVAALGGMLMRTGRHQEAIVELSRAVRLDPHQARAWSDLGVAHGALHQIDEAAAAYRQCLDAAPSEGSARLNLGMLSLDLARSEEAIGLLRELRADHPLDPTIAQALASAMNYSDASTREDVLGAHKSYGRIVGAMTAGKAFRAPPRGDGPLRVGYLSPDLYDHSVAYFLLPLLQAHDRSRVRAVAISVGTATDDMTSALRNAVDEWVEAAGLQGDALIARLRELRLDILVELDGLFLHSRLPELAARVAPVQVTAIGYPNTTGVPAMDYRLVDGVTDPADPPFEADRFATERLLRIPGCFLCYGPPQDAPDPSPPPSAGGAPVTFGSFNTIRKVTPSGVRAWASVLAAVPDSRLMLKTGSQLAQKHVRELFAGRGIAPDRVSFRGHLPGKGAHLAAYADIDVALDTFPYNGTTTTCEALWMGVPVVTRAGLPHASRVGASLLAAVGLDALVAPDEAGYVARAMDLARAPEQRESLRRELRPRMAASPLCDAASYAARLEDAYDRIRT